MNENTHTGNPIPEPDEATEALTAPAAEQPAESAVTPDPQSSPRPAAASTPDPGTARQPQAGPSGSPGGASPGYPPPGSVPPPPVPPSSGGYQGGGYSSGGYQAGGYPPPGPYPSGAYPPPGGYPPPGAYPPPGSYPPPGGAQGAGPQPTGTYAPVRRLTRSRSERIVGGVCGGLARYWNTDPILLRILTVVLTLATGGAFLVGYLIAWIAIPDEPMGPYGPFPQSPRADQVGYAAGGNPPYADQSARAADAPRERSYTGWLVVSAVVLIAGVLGLIGFLAAPSVQFWAVLFSVILALLGVGLLVGAWYGRVRWLALLAVPMAFLAFGTVSAGNWIQENPNWGMWSEGGGALTVGERSWEVTPTDITGDPLEYSLSAGDAVLDLTGLTADPAVPVDAQRVQVSAGVGLGQLVVLVPPDMTLELDADVDVGQITVPGRDRAEGTALNVRTILEPVSVEQPAYIVTLDAAIGVGNLEVRRAQA